MRSWIKSRVGLAFAAALAAAGAAVFVHSVLTLKPIVVGVFSARDDDRLAVYPHITDRRTVLLPQSAPQSRAAPLPPDARRVDEIFKELGEARKSAEEEVMRLQAEDSRREASESRKRKGAKGRKRDDAEALERLKREEEALQALKALKRQEAEALEALKREQAEAKTRQEESCRIKLHRLGVLVVAGSQCIDLDEIITNLQTGVYRFNKPDSAYVEESFRLVLTLTTAPGQNVIEPFRGTEGTVIERPATFAQHLEAALHGGVDFKVNPPEPQQRIATSTSPVVWEWNVTPLKSGKRTIVIEVSALLVLGSEKERVSLKTLYEPIEIQVRLFHFVKAAVSEFWGIGVGLATMTIAILGMIHYLKQLRRHHEGLSHSDEPPALELVTHSISSHADDPSEASEARIEPPS